MTDTKMTDTKMTDTKMTDTKMTDTKSGIPQTEPLAKTANLQPIPITDRGYVMTPVIPLPPPYLLDASRFMTPIIPLPPPDPYGHLKLEKYMDEDQKKAVTKMVLDINIDFMNAQLELANHFTQKQVEMLKRINEMIK